MFEFQLDVGFEFLIDKMLKANIELVQEPVQHLPEVVFTADFLTNHMPCTQDYRG